MPENRKLRVFLCHASQDKPIVRELYQRLSAEGWIDPWLDEEKLLPGQDWNIEIEKAVEAADAVVVCLSNNSVTKEGYIQKEIRKALNVADEKPDETIFIIPLRLDDCLVPRRLAKWQYEDYFPKQKQPDVYKRILKSLMLRGSALGLNGQIKKFLLDEKKLIFGEISFVFIRSGKYIAGDVKRSDSKNIYKSPENEQVIPYDYWIACDPITNQQYAKFANELALGSYFSKGKNNHPVTGITWKNAMKFVKWMNKKYDVALPTDYRFDLPSPEEWEKAARGLDGRTYPWGDNFDERKCNTRRSNIGGTTPVGKYSPEGDSPYGARDMAGNVWEWTSNSISGNRDSLHRIMCGGSFGDDHIYARCSFRMTYPITASADSFGFRLAIVPPEKIRNELHFPTL